MAISKGVQAILIVVLIVGASAAGPDDLLWKAKEILGDASYAVQDGLHELVDGLFGPENSFFTQIPSDIEHLSWDSIQNLGFTDPVSDFLGSIKNKTLVHDILEAESKVTDFIGQFCTNSTLEESEKIPSNCVGKQLTVKLAPWACKLYENKTVACNPAYIEVIQTPAECTAKYESAAVFTGKYCRLRKTIGQEFNRTIGGDAFSVDISKNLLSIPQQVSSSLLPGVFDSVSTWAPSADPKISTAGRR